MQRVADSGRAWDPPAVAEPTLKERPLELLCENASSAAGTWQPVVWDEPRRCFAFHMPRALEPLTAAHFFVRLQNEAPWQPLMDKAKTKVSRHTVWHTRQKDCNCAYTYGEDTRIETPVDEGFRTLMEELFECVFSKFPHMPRESWPNCANLNLYASGDEGVGWHADDELIFMGTVRDCPILSLSLGATREFWIALQEEGNPDVRQGVVEVDLKDGDLITMEGLMQKHCMHLVPKACPSDELRNGCRINVTFRWMRLHKLDCPYAQVASTWFKLSQSLSPTSQQQAQRGKNQWMTVLDPVTGEPVEMDELRSWKRRPRGGTKTAVMSPLPLSARALFGEGPRKFLTDLPRPGDSQAYLCGWATQPGKASGPVKWQACDACGHTCWGGGRPCQEDPSSEQWFCRCCWQSWAQAELEAMTYEYLQQAGLMGNPYLCAGPGLFPYEYADWRVSVSPETALEESLS
eukprot:TRINITY_DN68348_c0_g1_i1.p1 TRINITY_DN68348_c0_g1~~TRINITY_DN68348_c0_g1_i1.p1  ORF type:complete len:462 (+),score=74.09 TRINITY_DN68348_c0_g1_i1:90-1475(+)